MRRVTSDQLAQLAFQNPGSEIEVDDEAGIQILTLPNRRVYYARLVGEEKAS